MSTLERSYRRLVRAYPAEYRRRRGEEIVATLLDAAGPAQRRPSRHDVADLLGGAARERLGLHALPGLAAGLRIAGPVALAFVTAYLAIQAEFRTRMWTVGPVDSSGSYPLTQNWKLPALIAVAWAMALLFRVLAPAADLIPTLAAWTLTIVALGTFDRNPAMANAVLLGAVAVIDAVARLGDPVRWSWPVRLALLGAAAVALPTMRLLYLATTGLVLLGTTIVGLVRFARHRNADVLWALTILLGPVGYLAADGWTPSMGQLIQPSSLLAVSLGLGVLVVAVGTARRRAPNGPLWTKESAVDLIRPAAGLALATLAGMSAFGLVATTWANDSPVESLTVAGYALILLATVARRWPWASIGLVTAATASFVVAYARVDRGSAWIEQQNSPFDATDVVSLLIGHGTYSWPFLVTMVRLGLATVLALAARPAPWPIRRTLGVAAATAVIVSVLSPIGRPDLWSLTMWEQIPWFFAENSISSWVVVPLAVLLVAMVPMAVAGGGWAAVAVACFGFTVFVCVMQLSWPAGLGEPIAITGTAMVALLVVRYSANRWAGDRAGPDLPTVTTG